MWVLSREPRKLKFSFGELQDSLNVNLPMPAELFNLGVRMISKNVEHKRQGVSASKSTHYMDISFSVRNKTLLILF